MQCYCWKEDSGEIIDNRTSKYPYQQQQQQHIGIFGPILTIYERSRNCMDTRYYFRINLYQLNSYQYMFGNSIDSLCFCELYESCKFNIYVKVCKMNLKYLLVSLNKKL